MEKTDKLTASCHESQVEEPICGDNFDFPLPEFESEEKFESWWNSLPTIEIEFDERLGQRVDVSLRLNQRMVDGFRYLAKQKGLQHGEDLMKIVLGQYLSDYLPDKA